MSGQREEILIAFGAVVVGSLYRGSNAQSHQLRHAQRHSTAKSAQQCTASSTRPNIVIHRSSSMSLDIRPDTIRINQAYPAHLSITLLNRYDNNLYTHSNDKLLRCLALLLRILVRKKLNFGCERTGQFLSLGIA